jgi:hypothetical protein
MKTLAQTSLVRAVDAGEWKARDNSPTIDRANG